MAIGVFKIGHLHFHVEVLLQSDSKRIISNEVIVILYLGFAQRGHLFHPSCMWFVIGDYNMGMSRTPTPAVNTLPPSQPF